MVHRTWAVTAVAALLLALVGCGSSAGHGGPGARAASTPPASSPSSVASPSSTGSGADAPGASATAEKVFDPVATLPAPPTAVFPGRSFFVAAGQDGWVTYTESGREVARTADAAAVDADCLLAVVGATPESGSLIWVESTETPAAGVEPAHWTLSVVATDTSTYTRRWTKPLIAHSDQPVGCDNAQDATVTSDGRWMTYDQWIVDLRDGASRALGDSIRPRALGDHVMVFDGVCANCLNGMRQLPVTDPATGRRLFAFTDHDLIGQLSEPGDFATSADGSALFVARRIDGPGDGPLTYALQSRSLTTGAVLWQHTGVSYTGPVEQHVTVDDAAGIVLIPELAATDDQGAPPTDPQRILAFTADSGHQLWALPTTTVCAAGRTGVTVAVNGQLAVVAPRTGHQTAYTPSLSDCGTPVGTAHTFYPDDGTLVRILP